MVCLFLVWKQYSHSKLPSSLFLTGRLIVNPFSHSIIPTVKKKKKVLNVFCGRETLKSNIFFMQNKTYQGTLDTHLSAH